MAVVTATLTPTLGITSQWGVPKIQDTAIPRALFTATGNVAIAAKGVGDETRLTSVITFNTSYSFILKTLVLTIFSDDQVLDFDSVGDVNVFRTAGASTIANFAIVSPGIAHQGATLAAIRSYHLEENFPRVLLDGDVQSLRLNVADISADASTAGDAFLYAEFLMYDKDQVREWPINSPLPRLSY